VFFGIGNFVFASYFVLGPVISKEELGGPAAWATLASSFGAGSILGGLVAILIRPRRPLLVSCIAADPARVGAHRARGGCNRQPGDAARRRRDRGSSLSIITRRRILFWLVAMVSVLVGGTIIGLIWADTSNVAGSIAVVTNIVGVAGILFLLIALAVVTRRQRRAV
jgi:hypothetical protein